MSAKCRVQYASKLLDRLLVTLAIALSLLCVAITLSILKQRQTPAAASTVTCVSVDPRLSFIRGQQLYGEADFRKVLRTGYLSSQSIHETERVCIVMSDSRDFVDLTETTAIDDIPYHQLSVYHHLLYAVRHGYDFRHIPTASRDGYHATWPKISVLLQLLAEQKYDLLVYMDADAFVTDLSIPLSTMLKIARFTPKYSLMLARDPPEDVNLSKAGVPNVNTGFIVVRNHTAARETLEAVLDCPETIPECEYLKRDWPHEQGALSSFILPKLDPGILLETSCDLFNGYDGESHCAGRFVSHLWNQKGQFAS